MRTGPHLAALFCKSNKKTIVSYRSGKPWLLRLFGQRDNTAETQRGANQPKGSRRRLRTVQPQGDYIADHNTTTRNASQSPPREETDTCTDNNTVQMTTQPNPHATHISPRGWGGGHNNKQYDNIQRNKHYKNDRPPSTYMTGLETKGKPCEASSGSSSILEGTEALSPA